MAALDLDKEMRVEADYATGGVLSMRCKDKK